ncbi:hypothetical protein B0I29_105113 [Actinoplanes lutulentus]|uniref:Uncharacterized protein n=1 Tax=Actinoplanes lutulentus TaxID=1287878 RepID=A0A327ZL85_9ACTN|nr:hypothetical protein B0I29_105113 [Actinoplanes lutulentus]
MILFVLLAVFVACCGYAAGRLHQRRQHGADRAEAYRDGYATGTSSVFSMAARAAGRRRERASARAAVPVPEKTAPKIVPKKDPVPKKEPEAESFPAPKAQLPPGLPEPAAPGGVTYSTLPDPQWSAPAEPVPPPRVAREGKHTVPEELVRAATYRLPPDRVARAKVAQPGDGKPPVPRPRNADKI